MLNVDPENYGLEVFVLGILLESAVKNSISMRYFGYFLQNGMSELTELT